MQLEREMIGLPETQKRELREVLEREEMLIQKESRKKITVSDFESLAVIGRGAFGEVRLVRRKGKPGDPQTGQILALKSMVSSVQLSSLKRHSIGASFFLHYCRIFRDISLIISHAHALNFSRLFVRVEKRKHDPQESSSSRQIRKRRPRYS